MGWVLTQPMDKLFSDCRKCSTKYQHIESNNIYRNISVRQVTKIYSRNTELVQHLQINVALAGEAQLVGALTC